MSVLWSVGVQLCNSRLASGESSSTLSPQSVVPLNGPLPVATRMSLLPGAMIAPARPQIAESLSAQVLGAISPGRFEHRVLKTCSIAPVLRFRVTTWP